jgi:integrase
MLAEAVTFGGWSRDWLERLKGLEVQGVLRDQTVATYGSAVRLHMGALYYTPLDQIRKPALIAWANDQIAEGASRKSLTLRVAVLKVCLRDAISEGLLDHNPAERLISCLRLPREDTRRRWFETTDQAGAFLAAAEGGKDWPALALLMYTGLRIGEALGLQWVEVDLDGRRLAVRRQVTQHGKVQTPKSAAGSRVVDLPSTLVDILRRERERQEAARLGGSPWVLGVEPRGNYAARYRIRRALDAALRKAGLARLTPHGLRHSWVSFRAQLGQDIRLIQEQAGHSDPKMTRHYTHLQRSDPGAADAFAEAIRPTPHGS